MAYGRKKFLLHSLIVSVILNHSFAQAGWLDDYKENREKKKQEKEEKKKAKEAKKKQESVCEFIEEEVYAHDYETCMNETYVIKVDCTSGNCYEDKGVNPWADVAAVALSGAAMVGGIWLQGHFANKSQEAWAASYANGQKECTTRYMSFLSYYEERGANPIDPNSGLSQASMCNGYGWNQYAGYGGMFGNGLGGILGGNPWLGAGYSQGYLNGMMGPWGGMYSPYGIPGFGNGMGMPPFGNMGMGFPNGMGPYGIGIGGCFPNSMSPFGMGPYGFNPFSGIGNGMANLGMGLNYGLNSMMYGINNGMNGLMNGLNGMMNGMYNPFQTQPYTPGIGFNPNVFGPGGVMIGPNGQLIPHPGGIIMDPYAQGQYNPYAQGQYNPYAQGQYNPYAQGQYNPYAQGQYNPYAQGQYNPYAQGQYNPYAQGQYNPYAQGQYNPYAPPGANVGMNNYPYYNNGSYWQNSNGNMQADWYQQQMQSQMAAQQQNQASYMRSQGNAQAQARANQAMYQEYQNYASNYYNSYQNQYSYYNSNPYGYNTSNYYTSNPYSMNNTGMYFSIGGGGNGYYGY